MKLGNKHISIASISVLGAAVIGLILLVLAITPATPQALQSITVTTNDSSISSVHYLTEEEAKLLFDSFQGEAVSQIPVSDSTIFKVRLNLRGRFARSYQVVAAANKDVYIKRPFSNTYLRSANPAFIYSHQAFQTIYPYSEGPKIRVLTSQQEIRPTIRNQQWKYLNWNGEWQQAIITPVTIEEQCIAVTATDQHIMLSKEFEPTSVGLVVVDESGRTVYESAAIGLDESLPIIDCNGSYDYQLQLLWENEAAPYRGQYEVSFAVEVDLPPTFELEDSLEQGELLIFRARHLKAGTKPVLQTTLTPEVTFFPLEDGYVAYLPTNYNTPAGDYTFSYGIEGESQQQAIVKILPRDFRVQHLIISSTTVSETQNEAAYAQFNRYAPQARETSHQERYYDSSFVVPVYGKLTTEFGQKRYVNNATSSTPHSGLDIAAPTGTPIVATNTGRVTLSMNFMLTGNTIIIDHGQGLFSVYYHLHQRFVTEGQLVQRGEQIGTVGTTGFSTGPHLHFMLSYYKQNLEPGYFLVGEPITFTNYSKYLLIK